MVSCWLPLLVWFAAVRIASEDVTISSEDTSRLISFEATSINTNTAPEFDAEPYPSPLFAGRSIAERLVSKIAVTFIVQVSSSSFADISKLSAEYNVELVRYLPHNAFLMLTTHKIAMAMLRSSSNVIWIGNLHPKHKLSLSLTKYQPKSSASSFFGVGLLGDPYPHFVVELTAPSNEAIARIRRLSQSVIVVRPDRLFVVSTSASLIAADPAVHWVERRLRHQFLNRWARGVMQNGMNITADYKGKTGLIGWDVNLDGDGQIIGLGDSGIDKGSCFFQSRTENKKAPSAGSRLYPVDLDMEGSDKIAALIPFADSTDANGHGTHLAGILAGDPQLPKGARGTLETFAGMAPKSRLVVFDVGDANGVVQLPDDLDAGYLGPIYDAGARIMTSAWGAPVPLYTHEAADMDAFMNSHPDVLIVTAAGNGGSCNEELTIVSPATAKSVITVGATMSVRMGYRKTELLPPGFGSFDDPNLNESNLAAFSSKGPTLDGRTKPDVVAPGYFIYSAATGQGSNRCDGELGSIVTPNAGTSMAAAVQAGVTALLRQYLMDGFYPGGRRNPRQGFIPSGSLMKALIINGAVILNGSRLVSDRGIQDPEHCPDAVFAPLLGPAFPSSAPSIDQGWGRFQLDQIIKKDDDDFLHIIGRNNKSQSTMGDPELGHGHEHRYRFCVLEAHTDIRATLAYTDMAATLGAGLQLVNDLDLSVESEGTVQFGNDAEQGDHRNPVERVSRTTTRPLVDLTVAVNGRRVTVGPTQSYSLVLMGRAIRHGPCRPHHELNLVTFQMLQENGEYPATAVRFLNTAKGLRSRPGSSSASRFSPTFIVLIVVIATVLMCP